MKPDGGNQDLNPAPTSHRRTWSRRSKTVQMLEKVYGHHRPDFQEAAAGALDKAGRRATEALDVEDAFTRRAA